MAEPKSSTGGFIKVNAPDGTVLKFPDTMSQQDILAVMRKKYPPTAPAPPTEQPAPPEPGKPQAPPAPASGLGAQPTGPVMQQEPLSSPSAPATEPVQPTGPEAPVPVFTPGTEQFATKSPLLPSQKPDAMKPSVPMGETVDAGPMKFTKVGDDPAKRSEYLAEQDKANRQASYYMAEYADLDQKALDERKAILQKSATAVGSMNREFNASIQRLEQKQQELMQRRAALEGMAGQDQELRDSQGNLMDVVSYKQAEQQYNADVQAFAREQKALGIQQDLIMDLARKGEMDSNAIARREHDIKAGIGNRPAGMAYSMLNTMGKALSGGAEIVGKALPSDQQILESIGLATKGTAAKAKEDWKLFLKDLENAPTAVTGIDQFVTPEYIQRRKEESLFDAGLFTLSEMAPAVAMSIVGGTPAMASTFFASSYRDMGNEMQGEYWDQVPEAEKEAIRIGVATVSAGLSTMGLQALAGRIPIVNDIFFKAAQKMLPNMTAGQVRRLIDAETKSYVANLMSKGVQGVLLEGPEEGLDYLSEEAVKNAYENYKRTEFGDKADTLFNNAETLEELGKGLWENVTIGSVAGTMMGGSLAAASSIGARQKLNDKEFKVFKEILGDGSLKRDFESQVAADLASGKIDRAEYDKLIDNLNTAQSIVEQIPEDMSIKATREAYDLLEEKAKLKKKDKALVGDRIAKIDEKLAALAGTAVDKKEEVSDKEPEPQAEPKAEEPTTTKTPPITPVPDQPATEVEWEGEDVQPKQKADAATAGADVQDVAAVDELPMGSEGGAGVQERVDSAGQVGGDTQDAQGVPAPEPEAPTDQVPPAGVPDERGEVATKPAEGPVRPEAKPGQGAGTEADPYLSENGKFSLWMDEDGNIQSEQVVPDSAFAPRSTKNRIKALKNGNPAKVAAKKARERAEKEFAAKFGGTRMVQEPEAKKIKRINKMASDADPMALGAFGRALSSLTNSKFSPASIVKELGGATGRGLREGEINMGNYKELYRDGRITEEAYKAIKLFGEDGGQSIEKAAELLALGEDGSGETMSEADLRDALMQAIGQGFNGRMDLYNAIENYINETGALLDPDERLRLEHERLMDQLAKEAIEAGVTEEDVAEAEKEADAKSAEEWQEYMEQTGSLSPTEEEVVRTYVPPTEEQPTTRSDEDQDGQEQPSTQGDTGAQDGEGEGQEAAGEGTAAEEGLTDEQARQSLSDRINKLADDLEKGLEGIAGAFPIPPQVAVAALRAVAAAVKAGETLSKAIAKGLKELRASDWYKGLTQSEKSQAEQEFIAPIKAMSVPEDKKPPASTKTQQQVKKATGQTPPASTPPPSERQSQKKDDKEVKKTFATVRAYEGSFRQEVKDRLERSGLYRNIENQEEAEASADEFIKSVGIAAALDAVRAGDVRGGAATVIRVRALEALDSAYMEASTQDDLEKIAIMMADLIEENSRVFLEAGQGSAMLSRMYTNSDLGFYSAKKAEEWKKEFGEEPSAEMMAEWKKRDEELRDLRKQLNDALKRAEEAEAKSAVDAIKQSIQRRRSKPKSNTEKAKELADRFRRLKARPMTFRDASGNIIEVKEMGMGWNELIELGAKTIEKTGQVVDALSAISEKLKEQAWFAALGEKDRIAVMEQIEDWFRSVSEEDADGRIRIPKSMIRAAVEAGANDIDTLVAVVKEQIREEYPEATDREIRDAITEYGKVLNMSQDEISAKIRRMKDIGRTISAIEDVENKKRPLRSGLQRDKLDAEQRALKKKLREMMKELPVDEETHQRQLKTSLDAAKTRMRNRIEDMQREIEMRERVRKVNKVLEPDAELSDLKARKDALQKQHDEIFKDKTITEDERLERAIGAARRSLEEYRRRIAEKELDPKKPPPVKANEELNKLRELVQSTKAEYERLQEEAGVIDRKRLEAAKAMAAQRIKDLQRRIDEKDFGKKEPRKAVSDTELVALRAKQVRIRELYDKEFHKHRLANRTKAQKVKDSIWELWGVTRALQATGELSFILMQGGALTISNLWHKPSAVKAAIRNMASAMRSRRKADQWLENVKAQEWYPAAKKAKLAITEPHAEMTAREELFFSDWTSAIWKGLGSPLRVVSPKAYQKWVDANPWQMFERGAVAYLDTLRVERYMDGVSMLEKNGIVPTEKELRDVADVVNTLTGRASLGRFETMKDTLSKLFFSPRLWSSAIKTATPYGLYHFGRMTPTARKMAMQDMGRFVGTTMGLVLMAAAYANNDDDEETSVEFDPRSSDFLKIKIGNTRIDPWGGRIQQVVLTTKLAIGAMSLFRDQPFMAHKNPKTGELYPLGLPFRSPTMFDAGLQMAMNKLAPSASLAVEAARTGLTKDPLTDEYTRINTFREEFELSDKAKEKLIPIYWTTVQELAKEDPGALEGFLMLYAFVGGGVNVYEQREKKPEKSEAEKAVYRLMLRKKRIEQAQATKDPEERQRLLRSLAGEGSED